MKIKVFTAFSGYDSQCLALERLSRDFPDFSYELVGWSEIDKYAIIAHNALFPGIPNYGDISKINWEEVPDFDLLTYSFPCTDISNAGQQKGFEEGSGTRSSLLWECRKAIIAKKPKYLLMENVKALVSKKFFPMLKNWIWELQEYGYTNFMQVLNAKDYGVPQNRERVFMVSILDENAKYEFPEPFPLEKRLKDVLEDEVDEKYYLSDKMIECFENRTQIAKEKGNGFRFAPTDGGGQMLDTYNQQIQQEVSCTIRTNINTANHHFIVMEKKENYLAIPEATKQGYAKAYEGDSVNLALPNSQTRRGRVGKQIANCLDTGCQQGVVVNENWKSVVGNKQMNPFRGSIDGESPCITSACGAGGGMTPMITDADIETTKSKEFIEQMRGHEKMQYRIRKLTPTEVFRLMGVDDADIDKIKASGVSNTQMYRMAGNSIVVNVLYHIFRKLYVDTESNKKQLKLF